MKRNKRTDKNKKQTEKLVDVPKFHATKVFQEWNAKYLVLNLILSNAL